MRIEQNGARGDENMAKGFSSLHSTMTSFCFHHNFSALLPSANVCVRHSALFSSCFAYFFICCRRRHRHCDAFRFAFVQKSQFLFCFVRHFYCKMEIVWNEATENEIIPTELFVPLSHPNNNWFLGRRKTFNAKEWHVLIANVIQLHFYLVSNASIVVVKVKMWANRTRFDDKSSSPEDSRQSFSMVPLISDQSIWCIVVPNRNWKYKNPFPIRNNIFFGLRRNTIIFWAFCVRLSLVDCWVVTCQIPVVSWTRTRARFEWRKKHDRIERQNELLCQAERPKCTCVCLLLGISFNVVVPGPISSTTHTATPISSTHSLFGIKQTIKPNIMLLKEGGGNDGTTKQETMRNKWTRTTFVRRFVCCIWQDF